MGARVPRARSAYLVAARRSTSSSSGRSGWYAGSVRRGADRTSRACWRPSWSAGCSCCAAPAASIGWLLLAQLVGPVPVRLRLDVRRLCLRATGGRPARGPVRGGLRTRTAGRWCSPRPSRSRFLVPDGRLLSPAVALVGLVRGRSFTATLLGGRTSVRALDAPFDDVRALRRAARLVAATLSRRSARHGRDAGGRGRVPGPALPARRPRPAPPAEVDRAGRAADPGRDHQLEPSTRARLFRPATYAAVPLLLVALPVSIGVAVLRYRLYDVDQVVTTTVVYVTLTVLLGRGLRRGDPGRRRPDRRRQPGHDRRGDPGGRPGLPAGPGGRAGPRRAGVQPAPLVGRAAASTTSSPTSGPAGASPSRWGRRSAARSATTRLEVYYWLPGQGAHADLHGTSSPTCRRAAGPHARPPRRPAARHRRARRPGRRTPRARPPARPGRARRGDRPAARRGAVAAGRGRAVPGADRQRGHRRATAARARPPRRRPAAAGRDRPRPAAPAGRARPGLAGARPARRLRTPARRRDPRAARAGPRRPARPPSTPGWDRRWPSWPAARRYARCST